MNALIDIGLPAPLRARLAAVGKSLPNWREVVDWRSADRLRCELLRLPELEDARVIKLRAVLEDVAERTPPGLARLCGLHTSYAMPGPFIVWVGLDCPYLARLGAELASALNACGIASDPPQMELHVTLGTLVTPGVGFAMRDMIDARRSEEYGRFAASQLTAYSVRVERVMLDVLPVYTPLCSVTLGQRRSGPRQ